MKFQWTEWNVSPLSIYEVLQKFNFVSFQFHLLGEMIRSKIKCFCFEKQVPTHANFISMISYIASWKLSSTRYQPMSSKDKNSLMVSPNLHNLILAPWVILPVHFLPWILGKDTSYYDNFLLCYLKCFYFVWLLNSILTLIYIEVFHICYLRVRWYTKNLLVNLLKINFG